MSSTFKWATPENIATALDTGLNSLGDGNTALSSSIDNASDLYQYMDIEFYMASATSGASPFVLLWLLVALDGTNYEDGSAGTPGTIPLRAADAAIPLRASVTATQRVSICNVAIPPEKFEILLQNKAGVALASSGNTLKYRRHNSQVV